jgi:hypothetical protein
MKLWGWLAVLAIGVCSASFASESIPTDFTASYLPLADLEAKLTENGLTVIGTYAINGNDQYTSVIYTSDELKKLGSQSGRGFISALRILHNAEKQELVASNPEYFIRAFFQKEYTYGMEQPVMKALEAALGKMTPTDDNLSAKKLAKYHFMVSMPHYDDFVRVAKGPTADLMATLEANAKGRIVYKLDIKGDGSSMLCGVGLPDGIEKFNDKLDTMEQSHLLPYMVLIENGEANILHAKFFLALSFPQLTMGEFMKIMSVPGNIEDAFKADFK